MAKCDRRSDARRQRNWQARYLHGQTVLNLLDDSLPIQQLAKLVLENFPKPNLDVQTPFEGH